MPKLTTVSYALLGCLAVGPSSAYELTKSIDTSGVQFVWPRTRSRLYEEPKNLVAHGLATAEPHMTGKRKSTVYTITAEGRYALHQWLLEAGDQPSTEHEAMLKVFYANFGDREGLLTQLAAMREEIAFAYGAMIGVLEALADGGHTIPEREHLTLLLIEHLAGTLAARSAWVVEAERRVGEWPDTQIDDRRRSDVRKRYQSLLADSRQALAEFEAVGPVD